MKFRFVCRIYADISKIRQDVDPAANNCPTECLEKSGTKQYLDINRFKFCETCPHKLFKDKFKSETETLIRELFDEKTADKFKFERYQQTLYGVMNLQDAPPGKVSVKSNALLSVYLSEKYRAERIDDLSKK